MSSRLYVHANDHTPFMTEVCELLENILCRPVSELEDWRRLLSDSRLVLNQMRSTCSPPNEAA